MPLGILSVLAAVLNLLLLLAGIYIYLALVRQIQARTVPALAEGERTFGLPEVFLAGALGTLLVLSAFVSFSHEGRLDLDSGDLIANGLISLGLFLFIAAFLHLRGLSVNEMGGFARLPMWRTLLTALVLLFAAYPLIFIADFVTQQVFSVPSSRQDIVEIFSQAPTLRERILVIVLAVAIAPLVEEFVFRFFIYGVLRRYLGRFVGLAANSLLFAAVHAHLPSAAPLFVLGLCFTLAYEWSGSILVAMTMHALFNALTLTALAFPELLQP